LLLTGCALVALLIVLLWPREPEPGYQGKSLSQWLTQYQDQFHIDGYMDTPELHEAQQAVKHIGTNALPCLLKWIDYQVPPWRYQLFASATKLRIFRSKLAVRKLLGEGEFRSGLACIGFEILGPEARQVMPELVTLMNTRERPDASRKATFALGHL